MNEANQAAFDKLYAQIQATGATHVCLEARYQHLFSPAPADGRVYMFPDMDDPNMAYLSNEAGQYERLDRVEASVRLLSRKTAIQTTPHELVRRKHSVYGVRHKHKRIRRDEQLKNFTPSMRLISLKKVIEIVGFNKTFIYAQVELHQFPLPVKLGHSRRAASRWVEEEVIEWVENLMSSRASKASVN